MEANQDMVYALVAVLLWTALCNDVSASEGTTCTSPVIYVLAVGDSPTGLRVTATAVTPDNPDHEEVITLPGAHLPSQECGEGYIRCPLECAENDEESLMCSFPVTSSATGSSMALLHLKQGSDLMLMQEKLVPVPSDLDCAPIEVFDRGPNVDYRYIVACLNLTSPVARYIFFLLLEYDKTNISSARLVDDTPLSRQYYLIEEHSLSKLVYSEPSNTACVIRGNIFMKDGSRVVTFELRDNPEFRQLEEHHDIDSCPNTLDFCTFENDLLRVQCSAGDVALYDMCRTESVVERYNATLNGTVYQCSEAGLNLFLYGTFLGVRPYGSGSDDVMDNFTLPFDDIIRAQCTGKEIPVLFMARRSGETYMLFLTSGHLVSLAQNSCIGDSCLDLDILRTEHAFIAGIFDYNSNEYIVVNLSCSESPVIARVLYTSPPVLTTLVLGNGTQPCHCPFRQPTPEPTESPTNRPSERPSEKPSTDPTDPQVFSLQSQGVEDDVIEPNINGGAIGGGTSAGVILLIFLIVVAILLVLCYQKGYWRNVPTRIANLTTRRDGSREQRPRPNDGQTSNPSSQRLGATGGSQDEVIVIPMQESRQPVIHNRGLGDGAEDTRHPPNDPQTSVATV